MKQPLLLTAALSITASVVFGQLLVKTGVTSAKSRVHPSFGFMGSSQGSMAGGVDEIRIWNVIRTPTELLASYNTTIPGNTPNLAAYWPMNEGSETMLKGERNARR